MQELLERIPTDWWVVGLVCYVLGIATAWRFAHHLERIRDAAHHARHHFDRAKDFAGHVSNNIAAFVISGAVFSAIVGGIGFLAYLRFIG